MSINVSNSVVSRAAEETVKQCTSPLVVGAARSGFSLMIGIINTLLRQSSRLPPETFSLMLSRKLAKVSTFYMTQRYKETFARFGIVNDLIFNGEFHLITGGPKWLDKANPTRACIRKYFGVKGMGDFLLITSHPREVLEYDAVIHSHLSPALWLQVPYYAKSPKFTSVRNPIGIVNSASFSLNAMASEYIQRFMPGESEDFIRQRMGLYKLTDLDVVRGLVQFLKNYLDEYLAVRDRYSVMRWEDLIEKPVETIQAIAAKLDITCSKDKAEAIWAPMDHVNTLQFHKHNYRKGKGIVGDWKNSLINEHMDIFRDCDFDRYLKELGYPVSPTLDRADYSPYQRLVERYVRRGEVYRNTGDPDLFGFSFNKSNIEASKFGFRSFPKRDWTHVERSTFTRDDVVEAVSDVAEDGCAKINRIYSKILEADLNDVEGKNALVKAVRSDCIDLMSDISDVRGLALCEDTFNAIEVRP
ncbi:MAG TPA: sulfotransferase domain-containing protein [Methylovirgula sp.]